MLSEALPRSVESEDPTAVRISEEFRFCFRPSAYEPAERDMIVGLEKPLNYVDRIIRYLQNFEYYQEKKAHAAPGVLFSGPKGTGKTLAARYVATQSDAFLCNLDKAVVERGKLAPISDVFEAAREYVKEVRKPVVLFKDEFDKRFIDEYGRTIEDGDQLLMELDGIEGRSHNAGVMFIGTANLNKQQLENPLFRDQRLDVIYFYPPVRREKVRLMDLLLERKAKDGATVDVDMESLSYFFGEEDTPALMEAVVEEAYLDEIDKSRRAGRETPPIITTDCISQTIVRRTLKNIREVDITPEEVVQNAVHELGHRTVAEHLGIYVPFVSVLPGIMSLGQTYFRDPRKNIGMKTLKDYVSAAQAGYIAEEMFCNAEISLGAKTDIEHARKVADEIVELMKYKAEVTPGAKLIAYHSLDEAKADILRDCEARARRIIGRYDKEVMMDMARMLAKKKTLLREDMSHYLEVHGQPKLVKKIRKVA